MQTGCFEPILLARNEGAIMKRVLMLLVFAGLLLGCLAAKTMPVGPQPQAIQLSQNTRTDQERWPPSYTFSRTPVSLLTSYYDYMIGSYNNLPLKVIPTSAGGGYFLTFQGRRAPTSNRRTFYAYLDPNGNIINCNEIGSYNIVEGYPGIGVDPVSGKPMYAWHSNTDTDTQLEVNFVSDAFIVGFAGLWNDIQTVIDNPRTVTAPNGTVTTDNEFIWPSIAIGPSPIANKRRAYVLARNSVYHTQASSENVVIAYTDFNGDDLEWGNTLVWGYTSIPELDQWNVDSVWRRPFLALTVDGAGNLYYVGYHLGRQADGVTPLNEEDIDIFKCTNYGQGTWSRLSFWSKIPSWNPPAVQGGQTGFFTGTGGTPFADSELFFELNNSSHINAAVDSNGRVHVLGAWALTNSQDAYYSELQYMKQFVFDPSTQQLQIHEVYPQKDPGDTHNQCFTPWDVEAPWGVVDSYDPNYGPVMATDWPFPHWDATAHSDAMMFHYNNPKITQANAQGMMAAVWQSSWRARRKNYYDDWAYHGYENTPEIFISVSPNNGFTWSEPIILNNQDVPEFANIKPMWVYPADQMIYTGMQNGYHTGKLGLMFYDDYTWGANAISPPYHPTPDGGRVMFCELQISFGPAQPPSDPFGSPIVLSNSMNLVAGVQIAGQNAQEDDVLAAYVSVNGTPQLRGKASVSLNGGVPVCSLQIYTESAAETVSFKVWDASTNIVYPIIETLPAQPGSTVGSWPEVFWLHSYYGIVATPVFNPVAGTYTTPRNVSITCSTPGAQIYYTTDGSDPTQDSSLYTGAINVSASTTIKAKAYKFNWMASAVQSAAYTITGTVATPEISPPTGFYTEAFEASIACSTPDATIRYTLNGTTPTTTSPIYTEPIPISAACSLKAKAWRTGWNSSTVATATYVITGTVTAPSFDPPPGSYIHVEVTISCSQAGAAIRYSLDGSDVDASSPLYEGPVPINFTSTLKARAFLPNWLPSEQIEGFYTVSTANPEEEQIPQTTQIHSAWPNPFSQRVTIAVSLTEKDRDASLSVYNLKGQKVRELELDFRHSGEVSWDGCDRQGQKLPAGIYLLRLNCKSGALTRKLMLRG